MDKPRVIVSVRVSSKHQQEQGFGHANQLRMLPALVAEQGWEIAAAPGRQSWDLRRGLRVDDRRGRR